MDIERRLLDQDPEQRQSRRGPAGAARARELASRLHRLVEDHGAGRLPGGARLSAHRGLGRSQGLGQVRLREDAGIPLGHPACAAGGRTARFRSAATSASRPGRTCPGEYRAMLRRLVVIQGDTEPASVEQQRHLGKTAPSLYDMRNVFQVNVEEGRHLWAMVYILQKYFGRDGREEAERAAAAPLRRRRQAAHARRLQRGDAGLALVPHVHLLHRPRRQDAAREPGAIRLRSAVAHLPLHADRGSAPHVRRRDRHRPHHPAHLRGDEGGRHRGPERHRQGARARRDRPADHAEEAQPALHAVARPVRLRGLDQRRQRLQRRPQGPLPGDQDRGRPPARAMRPIRCSSSSTARSSASTSRRSPPSTCGCATTTPPTASAASTAGTRSSSGSASNFRFELPHVAFHRQIGEFKDVKATPDGRAGRRGDLEPRRRTSGCRRRTTATSSQSLMKPGHRARQVRELDRPAAGRHRQQARRLRIREDRGLARVRVAKAKRARVQRGEHVQST